LPIVGTNAMRFASARCVERSAAVCRIFIGVVWGVKLGSAPVFPGVRTRD
jgi:hypothetical protein